MAIQKAIELENGVTVNYHRVVSVNNIINHASIIEVASYTGEAKRNEEKNAQPGEQINVFIHTNFMNAGYGEATDTGSAYAYIKSLPMFSGAIDV